MLLSSISIIFQNSYLTKNELIEYFFKKSCCHLRYHNRKEQVLEEIRKEEEAVADNVFEENFENCCPSLRKKVWDLMENPQTSKAARVITHNICCPLLCYIFILQLSLKNKNEYYLSFSYDVQMVKTKRFLYLYLSRKK